MDKLDKINKLKKILTRAKNLEDNSNVALAREFYDIDEKINNISDELKKKLERELVLEFDKEELKGEPGTDGEDGEDGKDYNLTPKDKKEIAKSIKVPVVEKVIEKTEIIHETPVVTNEIKEIAVGDTRKEIVTKINKGKTNDLKIKIKQIDGIDNLATTKNLDRAISILDQRSQFLINKKSASDWGTIKGTITNQTDLQAALDLKAPLASPTFTGAVTTPDLTIANMTAGSVLFAGTGGAVTQDNANFFWDDTNNYLGLGTTTPSVELDVVGAVTISGNLTVDTTTLFVDSVNNKVGVGTITPVSTLEIQSGLTTTGAVLTLGTKETSVVASDVLGQINFYAPLDVGVDSDITAASIVAIAEGTFSDTSNATSLQFRTGASEIATTKMTILSDGNVGIGTSSPGHPLEVSHTGTLTAVRISKTQVANDTGSWGLQLTGGGAGTSAIGYVGFAHNNGGADTLFTGETDDAMVIRSEADLHLGGGGNNLQMTLDGTNVGIGTITPNQLFTVENSMSLKEIASANADTVAYGQIWVKDDTPNHLFFTDDAGTDKEVKMVDTYYAEMYEYENASSLVIGTQNIYHALPNFITGSLSGFTFVTGIEGVIASVADYSGTVAGTVLITDVAHGLLTGDIVTIHGTTNYNGTFSITKVTADTFYITETDAGTETGTWAMGSYLLASAGSDGTYKVSWNITAFAASANTIFKFEANKNTTTLDNIVATRKFASTDYGSMAASGLVAIVAGDRIWMSTQNQTSTTDITVRHANVNIVRL